jgi:hypothetical protein
VWLWRRNGPALEALEAQTRAAALKAKSRAFDPAQAKAQRAQAVQVRVPIDAPCPQCLRHTDPMHAHK